MEMLLIYHLVFLIHLISLRPLKFMEQDILKIQTLINMRQRWLMICTWILMMKQKVY